MSNHDTIRPWTELTALDVMIPDVVTVSYSAPLSEVERLLAENRISGMPVTNVSGHVIGVISVTDLIERYASDPDSRPRRGHGYFHLSSSEMDDVDYDSYDLPEESEETAERLMNAEVYAVAPDASLRAVAAAMVEHKIHRLLVQDESRCLGIVTTLEVLGAIAK